MLRKIRIAIAAIVFVLIMLLFFDFTGILHTLAKIQLVPAILAVNVGIIAALVLLTLLFGRIYCSIICPLGILQDGISWVAGKRKKKKSRFKYSPAKSWLRYGVLALFIVALVAGISQIIALLDPYSAFGRIAANLFTPLYQWGNNLIAYFAERVNSYAVYSVDVWLKNGVTFAIATITLAVIGILAWRNGRTYCNTICPVGTALGILSKFSLFRPTINSEKCARCRRCERGCKASCIDLKSYSIDYSRCVACMNCIDKCSHNAIKYIPRKMSAKKVQKETEVAVQPVGKEDSSRRSFLSLTALLAFTGATGVLKAQQMHVDGGLAVIEDKKIPNRETPIVPPGAQSARNFNKHCTACQLCVSVCPNGILRPSSKLSNLMQPQMSYERGYCRPECTQCSEVCPTGAIQRITAAEKSAIQIGRAVWIKENCVVNTDEVTCTSCEYHCPTGAITLVARDPGYSDSLRIPTIDNERCIGCGACENLCPARPFSAIYVEGVTRHRIV